MDCTSPIFGQFPCGKCINCRARSRQEWIFRLRMEYQACTFGLFCTFTYSDENLPPDGVCLRHVQLFLKRLRKNFNAKSLRYFIVSEYGDHTYRPHYHGLLFFNIPRTNDIYDIIEKSWQYGFVQFGEIEEGSITYCTKYCLKGSDVPKNANKNFRLLSKMHGGIGVNHLNDQFDFYLSHIDEPQMVTCRENKSPMPRYYRTKLLSQLDEADKDTIRILYQQNCEKLKAKREKKLLQRFQHDRPDNDPNEIPFHQFKSNFEIWLDERLERKEEALINRTKKQNLL